MAKEKVNTFFNKWWLVLLHGLLLVLLSYVLFSQPDKSLAAAGFAAGFIALLTGSISLIGYFLAGKNEKNKIDIYVGMCSCLAGLFFLSGTAPAHNLVIWLFAAYTTLNTVIAVSAGWQLRTEINWWWYSLLLVLYTLMLLSFFITGNTILDISINVFTGAGFFINGMLIVVLAFVVRKLQYEYGQTIHQIRRHEEQ